MNKFTEMIEAIQEISKDGLLGFYNYCGVTEVFAYNKNTKQTINVYSLIVFDEKKDQLQKNPQIINKDERIEIHELKNDYFFGIVQYDIEISQLLDKIDVYNNTKKWALSTTTLLTGDLVNTPRSFVPIEATEITPLNKLLKNNFWNGSHIFELFDNSKSHLHMLTEKPEILQKLSEKLQKYLPLEIASLSDRLGNIIIQIPVTYFPRFADVVFDELNFPFFCALGY